MNTLRFDDDFLLKYGGLFQTEKLSALMDSKIEQIDERIKAEYPNRVTLYWYIHPEDKNEVLLARHLQIDASDPKLVSSFANSFKSAFAKKFTSLALDERKKLFLSYAIIDHEGLHKNFSSITLGMNEKERYKAIASIDKAIFRAVNRIKHPLKFLSLGHIINTRFFQWCWQNIFPILSFLFTLLTFVLVSKLKSIPVDTIDLKALSYALTDVLLMYMKVFLLIWSFTMVVAVILAISLKGLSCKTQMQHKIDIAYEVKSIYEIVILLFAVGAIVNLLVILALGQSNRFIDTALKNYLANAQTPAYLEMQYQDLNESKIEKVLYLGESGENVFFLPANDVHHLLFRDPELAQSLCMGKSHGNYMQSMFPMIKARTFDNRVYYRTRSSSVKLRQKGLPFQETFCFNFYPKEAHLKSTKEDLLLMGINDDDSNKKIFYYYDLALIKDKILTQEDICDVNNSLDLKKKIMRSEVLKDIPYIKGHLNKDDFEHFELYEYICTEPKVK